MRPSGAKAKAVTSSSMVMDGLSRDCAAAGPKNGEKDRPQRHQALRSGRKRAGRFATKNRIELAKVRWRGGGGVMVWDEEECTPGSKIFPAGANSSSAVRVKPGFCTSSGHSASWPV